jgi:hypothetical protein
LTEISSWASKSDEELAALEQDRSLPIDQWMAVEAERGRRAKQRKQSTNSAPAPAAASAASASLQPDDERIGAGLQELRGLLVPGERLLCYAVQRRVFSLMHRRVIVAATTGRFLSLSRGLLGGYQPQDVRWQDLRDVKISAGVFGATLSIVAMVNDDLASHGHAGGRQLTYDGLRKQQAQDVYKVCQAQEQAWREKRRVRDLDEMRAESGGIQFGQGIPTAVPSVPGGLSSDPAERLRRAKDMLDNGLITDAEYESIKARIVDGL